MYTLPKYCYWQGLLDTVVLVLACDITWGYSGALPSSSNLESAYALLANETKNAQVNIHFISVLKSIQ